MHPLSVRNHLKGLYVILDERWESTCSLVNVLKQMGECGVRLVQYRNKGGALREAYAQAMKLRDMAGNNGMTFIVNDRCDLALAVEADGVHLGQLDLPLEMARHLMGDDRVIGVSTHRIEEVKAATRGGADYLGFGPIYATSTKTDHEPIVGLDGLRRVRELTELPIFAIGGIDPSSVADVSVAGADGVAVASAILDSRNREETVAQFMSAFQS